MIFNLMKPVPVDEPTMYLYGHEAEADETPTAYIGDVGYVGEVLPKLPSWDKDTYPYAAMCCNSEQKYFVYFSKTPFRKAIYVGNKPDDGNGTGSIAYYYDAETETWTYSHTYETEVYLVVPLKWSNHDIVEIGTDGSVYIKATEPIPLGEIVAYSYNGTVLPKLPEWDKTAYPYAVISNLRARLICSSVPLLYKKGIAFEYLNASEDGTSILYKNNTELGSWELSEEHDTTVFSKGETVLYHDLTWSYVWTNHDILKEDDGTLFLEETEPIPVYE